MPLAKRGYQVLAVDIGAEMLSVARRNLASYPNVELLHADVGVWRRPAADFDLIVSATAFHWLDPANRLARVARLLRPAGLLALIHTVHIAGPSDAFFSEAQRCYERWDPDTPPDLRLLRLDQLPDVGQYDLEAAPGFTDVELRRFPVDYRYDADQYLDLVATFSNHRALSPINREGLFARLRRRIEAESERGRATAACPQPPDGGGRRGRRGTRPADRVAAPRWLLLLL
ncbi:class I SAM-dependent methyltransferase [Actinomycetospora sp.]|uniref:class I SAM-dependent methyltransferase n=1 Tax=Actinomycetospora sp. TaxID=1872135 RepID=UPI0039C857AE